MTDNFQEGDGDGHLAIKAYGQGRDVYGHFTVFYGYGSTVRFVNFILRYGTVRFYIQIPIYGTDFLRSVKTVNTVIP